MRRWLVAATVAALSSAGAVAYGNTNATTAQTSGGLAVSPTLFSGTGAKAGPLGTAVVANHSSASLAITVTPRPWLESADGAVVPNRRKTLSSQVRLSATKFTLAPGASQNVDLTLLTTPSSGALYGALEVTGVPTDAAKHKGIVLGYRLVSTLRLLPTTPKLSLSLAKAVKVSPKRAATLALTNKGNTLDPVSGSFKIKGLGGSTSGSLTNVAIVPGDSIQLSLADKLAKGSYKATITLTQAKKRLVKTTRKFRVK